MKCMHCHRTIRQAWAMSFLGPVGPKCGRAIGLTRTRDTPLPRKVSRGRAEDPRQVDWIGVAA